MASLGEYTEQQSRFYLSFSRGGTCCSDTCEACGRTYFITSQGHGDYNEGELESLREKAAAEPDKYIEVPDFRYWRHSVLMTNSASDRRQGKPSLAA